MTKAELWEVYEEFCNHHVNFTDPALSDGKANGVIFTLNSAIAQLFYPDRWGKDMKPWTYGADVVIGKSEVITEVLKMVLPTDDGTPWAFTKRVDLQKIKRLFTPLKDHRKQKC